MELEECNVVIYEREIDVWERCICNKAEVYTWK